MDLENMPAEKEINESELKKYETAIRDFLKQYFSNAIGGGKTGFDNMVDFSDPKIEDMKKLKSGNFEITNFKIYDYTLNKNKKAFHFYVGKTEVHITDKASDNIIDSLEKEN